MIDRRRTIRFTDEEWAQVDDIAKVVGRDRAWVIRRLVTTTWSRLFILEEGAPKTRLSPIEETRFLADANLLR